MLEEMKHRPSQKEINTV